MSGYCKDNSYYCLVCPSVSVSRRQKNEIKNEAKCEQR